MKEEIVDNKTAQKYTRRSWLSFGIFSVLSAAGFAGWRWLNRQPKDSRSGILQPLRDGLNLSDEVFEKTFDPNKLIKEYAKTEAATKVRTNGKVGLATAIPTEWTLLIKKLNGETLNISLEDLKKLPKTEVIYNFKCIEGWSQISWWGGVRFADVVKHYGLEKEVESHYIGMSTPDAKYYVGIDTPSVMHAQTILSYEMNGNPLEINHGSPLRLIIPVKYGVKNLKRVGNITFNNEKPADYWAERGYDYFCGH
jgi:DMSO/TMAO reductase YedYZ molybdopterin-dependent catalytic subunit